MPLCGRSIRKRPPWTSGTSGGFENWNKPTPTIRDRSLLPAILHMSGFSGELAALECAAAFSVDTWLALACWSLDPACKQLGRSALQQGNAYNSILQALPHGGKQVHEGVGVIVPGNG